MKRETFNVMFFIQKTRLLKNGEAPIIVRITMKGEIAEIRLLRTVLPAKWCAGKAIGRDANTQELNKYLDRVKAKILKI